MTTTTADQASPRPMAGAAAEPPPEKVAHPPVAERAARGRGVRTSCPRQVHTAAAIEARDPVALLEANAPARIEELAPRIAPAENEIGDEQRCHGPIRDAVAGITGADVLMLRALADVRKAIVGLDHLPLTIDA